MTVPDLKARKREAGMREQREAAEALAAFVCDGQWVDGSYEPVPLSELLPLVRELARAHGIEDAYDWPVKNDEGDDELL